MKGAHDAVDEFSRTSTLPSGRVIRGLVAGAAAGLVANAVVKVADPFLSRLISDEQKRRQKMVRDASPHDIAGITIAEKVSGEKLNRAQQRNAQRAFSLMYGLGWGLAYAALRKRLPWVTRAAGLPFGIAFFAACDGMIAPLLKLSPPLNRIPWQPSAKELTNHVAWTAAAEMAHRGVARLAA